MTVKSAESSAPEISMKMTVNFVVNLLFEWTFLLLYIDVNFSVGCVFKQRFWYSIATFLV